MNSSILEIHDLSFSYGSQNILNNINLSFEENELAGIIGPNGSGKTTLLKNITGILKSETGIVKFRNNNLSSMNKNEISRNIAVVSQSSEIFSLTVKEFVMLGRIPYFIKYKFFETNNDEIID
jgi:iron complex transport system ATP-binding protein